MTIHLSSPLNLHIIAIQHLNNLQYGNIDFSFASHEIYYHNRGIRHVWHIGISMGFFPLSVVKVSN